MTSKYLSLAAAAAMLLSVPIAAAAAPLIVIDPGGVRVGRPACGPMMHRGPRGGCQPNRGPAIIVRQPVCRIVGLIPHRVCN